MRSYTTSKPPSTVDPDWIYWTQSHFTSIAPDSQQISSLLFITRKKEIEILFKPTPVVTSEGKLEGIIGNMFDEGSTPAIIRINGEDIGSCMTIRIFSNVPETFRPECPLLADSVKDTEWEATDKEITLIVIPTVAPLPYVADIKSTILNDNFIKEMQAISPEHGFWAKMMADAHEQYSTDFDTSTIVKKSFCCNVFRKT